MAMVDTCTNSTKMAEVKSSVSGRRYDFPNIFQRRVSVVACPGYYPFSGCINQILLVGTSLAGPVNYTRRFSIDAKESQFGSLWN